MGHQETDVVSQNRLNDDNVTRQQNLTQKKLDTQISQQEEDGNPSRCLQERINSPRHNQSQSRTTRSSVNGTDATRAQTPQVNQPAPQKQSRRKSRSTTNSPRGVRSSPRTHRHRGARDEALLQAAANSSFSVYVSSPSSLETPETPDKSSCDGASESSLDVSSTASQATSSAQDRPRPQQPGTGGRSSSSSSLLQPSSLTVSSSTGSSHTPTASYHPAPRQEQLSEAAATHSHEAVQPGGRSEVRHYSLDPQPDSTRAGPRSVRSLAETQSHPTPRRGGRSASRGPTLAGGGPTLTPRPITSLEEPLSPVSTPGVLDATEKSVEETVEHVKLNAASSEPNVRDVLSWSASPWRVTGVLMMGGLLALIGGAVGVRRWRPGWLTLLWPYFVPSVDTVGQKD